MPDELAGARDPLKGIAKVLHNVYPQIRSSVPSMPRHSREGPEAFAGGSGSVVERLLAKEKVAGSNPVFRSIFV